LRNASKNPSISARVVVYLRATSNSGRRRRRAAGEE